MLYILLKIYYPKEYITFFKQQGQDRICGIKKLHT